MSDPAAPDPEAGVRTDETSADERADEAGYSAPTYAYVGMGAAIAIGAGIGLVFGTMLDNIALGLACGAGLGTVAGAIIGSGRRRG
jgi:hypothetical protein